MNIESILNRNFFSEGDFPPNLNIDDKISDKKIIWNKNYKLYDLSAIYYNSPYYDFIIRLKNKDLGRDEYEWPDGETITIPYPLNSTITQIKDNYDNYIKIW